MLTRILFYICGLLITTLGITWIIKSGIGTGPWDAVFVGLNQNFGLTVGTWVYIVQALLLLTTSALIKEKPDISSFITIFLRGLFLDFWLYIIFYRIFLDSIMLSIIFFVIGTILLGIGISTYLISGYPKSPIDGLMIAIHKKGNLSVRISRTLVEVLAVIIGFILGGPIGIGTIIISFSLGPIIQLSNKFIRRLFERYQ
ncbi:YczE/YyaS/YitT family protein [Pontibacillus marinus]|uniref:BCR, YitT family protein n=1 Tax=Pontibacillus marinus BH030004 = DSM 16465 TaxID=1385511 RepID=A0A0A5GII7_9BACI|nr:YitT family protein [Pontibacillus marinus]KGX91008.1 hypothetical protein N783_13605 [Pontibacillus marinus BH030004 = DSM 16465]